MLIITRCAFSRQTYRRHYTVKVRAEFKYSDFENVIYNTKNTYIYIYHIGNGSDRGFTRLAFRIGFSNYDIYLNILVLLVVGITRSIVVRFTCTRASPR